MKTDSILPETDYFFSENDTVLSNEERDSIEGLLTELECLNALKDMEPDKSPGTDGLPSEFYQSFWSDVSKPLLKALNYDFEIGQLSISQKQGIIKLIPKKSEELYYIKNWRPLTLLNCDYKIATKAIANPLKTHLHKLINNDQTGFLKGWFIGENIRLIDSVVNYTATKNIPVGQATSFGPQGCPPRLSSLSLYFYSFSRNSGQSNPKKCRHKRFIS